MKTINNNIEEQRVGFDNAKLLNEKGFKVPCNTHTFISNTNNIVQETSISCIDWGNRILKTVQKYSSPTQQVAIDWVRINFGINIEANRLSNIGKYAWLAIPHDFIPKSFKTKKEYANSSLNYYSKIGVYYETPEEAKEAAINHFLTNLL